MRHNPILFKMSPRPLWMLFESWRAFAGTLTFTLFMLYQARVANLDALQMVAVGTALEIGILFFEVPTGVVADAYSRRVSVILGALVVGVGFIIMGLQATFLAHVIGSVIWGIGHTFFSGAAQAWLSDEIGEAQASRAFIASAQYQQLASFFAIIVAVIIGWSDLAAPVWVGGIMFVLLSVFLLCVMPEDGFRPTPIERRQTFGHMVNTFRSGVSTIRGRPLLVTLILITLVFAAQSESFDRLWTKHMLDNFSLPVFTDLPIFGTVDAAQSEVLLFSGISMISLMIGVGVMNIIRRRITGENPEILARNLFYVIIALVGLFFVFANAGSLGVALLCLFLIGPLRRVIAPLHLSLINRGINPQIRATILSLDGQTDAIGQLAGGIPLGIVGNMFGVRAAITGGALLLLPGIWLGARAIKLARGLPVGESPESIETA